MESPVPDRVLVSSSAFHGNAPAGPRRLPERVDHQGVVGAYLVATEDDAVRVFRDLDEEGRTIFVDVERKQPVELMAIARQTVRRATVETVKPNDVTVNALEATLLHAFGPDLSGLRVGIVGTGNLGFKIALRLAERSCDVFVASRRTESVRRTVEAITAILPHHEPHRPTAWDGEQVDVLISVVTASRYVGGAWAARVRPGGLAIDIGIDNFDPEFIVEAHRHRVECRRLDVRAAPQQVTSLQHSEFFGSMAGRAQVDGLRIVSGGIIGARGELVVDRARHPSRVIGVANGTGGLLAEAEWSDDERDRHGRLTRLLSAGPVEAEPIADSFPSHERA